MSELERRIKELERRADALEATDQRANEVFTTIAAICTEIHEILVCIDERLEALAKQHTCGKGPPK